MEKRRRARINASLTELKSLLLEAIKKEGARHNKMEKADILEMAVKHLRQIQRQQCAGEAANDPSVISKYRLGFDACAQEVCKYLGSNSDEDIELKTKLLNHLANCMTSAHFQSNYHPQTASSSSISSLLSSPASSSTTLPVPLSPLSVGSMSPSSSTLSPEGHVTLRVDSTVGPASSDVKLSTVGGSMQNLSLNHQSNTLHTESVSRKLALSSSDEIQCSLPTSSSAPTSSLSPLGLKCHTVSVTPSPAIVNSVLPVRVDKDNKDDDHNNNNNNNDRAGNLHDVPVTEINNNTITLPAFINIGGSTTLVPLQQQHQHQLQLQQQTQLQHLSQVQPQQQQHQQLQQTQPQQQQQQQNPAIQDNSGLIANLNQLQLIPTKTATGEIAYVLSANVLNPAHFPSYAIPVIAPTAVNHAPVLAPAVPQQAIRIALSYPQEEQHQPIAFIPQIAQSQLIAANQGQISQHSLPQQQATPLNLSASQHLTQATNSSGLVHHDSNPRSSPAEALMTVSVTPSSQSSNENPVFSPHVSVNPAHRSCDRNISTNQIAGPSTTSSHAFDKPIDYPSHAQSLSVAVVKPHSNTNTHVPQSQPIRDSKGELVFPESTTSEEQLKVSSGKDTNFFRPW